MCPELIKMFIIIHLFPTTVLIPLQRLFMMEDQEIILDKMEDPENAVEFRDATLAWNKACPPPTKRAKPHPGQNRGGMRRVLRREKLSLYISSEEEKAKGQEANAEHLLNHMEQESPQSTISSTQSVRPPLHKTLHRVQLSVRKVFIYLILSHFLLCIFFTGVLSSIY